MVQIKSYSWPQNPTSDVYCQGPLLDAVQRAGIYNDSKTFVDMPMKYDPTVILEKFQTLSNQNELTPEVLKNFVEENFSPAGQELELWTPDDWTPTPSLVNRVSSPVYKDFVLQLNNLWKILGRQFKQSVIDTPERHSLLQVPHPFIVPGDRFREFYYWDTYWIIQGLLLCDMTRTAKNMIQNFIHIINKYGIMPNGGRIYYLNRSQPPMLTPMVNLYYEATKDIEFISQVLPTLEEEYKFWREHRTAAIEIGGKVHRLSHFSAFVDQPRPEGYMEDLHAAKGLKADEARVLYGDLAAAAETGWDFSSRWFAWDGPRAMSISSVKTNQIIPTDLNTYLHWTEKLLAKFRLLCGDETKSRMYEGYASARSESMQELMWNEEDGTWYDFDLEKMTQRRRFYLSNFFPLLTVSNDDVSKKIAMADKVVDYIEKHDVQLPAGMPTSFQETGEQWDFPNAWSPLVSLVVSALEETSSMRAQKMAQEISKTWVESNLVSWQTYGQMYEKYNATAKGSIGHGGEYTVQVGFGWTNGVLLELLSKYGNVLETPEVVITPGVALPTKAANALDFF